MAEAATRQAPEIEETSASVLEITSTMNAGADTAERAGKVSASRR